MVTIRHPRAIYASLALMVCLPSIAAATSCPPPLAAAQCVPPLVDDWWCDGNAYIIGGPEECQSNPDEGLHCSTLDEVELIISANWFAHEHCSDYYDVLVKDWYHDFPFDIAVKHSRRFDVHLVPPHDPPLENFCENDTNNAHAWCDRWVHCPDGYQDARTYGINACYRVGDKPLDPEKNLGPCPADSGGTPKTPNPINIGMGNKYLLQVDIPDTSSGLTFKRSYNSTNAAPNTTMGAGWQHNWDLRLNVVPIVGAGNLFSGTASARRSTGRVLVFNKLSSGTTWTSDPDVTDQLVEVSSGGNVTGYQIIDGTTDRIETYDLSGYLISVSDQRIANTFTLAYDSRNRLATVTDRSGRSVQLDYDNFSRVSAVWGPETVYGSSSGPSVSFTYSGAGRLDSATWNGTSVKQYIYENPTYPYALTGIVDENGNRFATYAYDSQGRAIAENLWADPGQTVPIAQYSLTFQANNITHVVDPLGQARDYQFTLAQGVAVLSNVSAPCVTCGGGSSTQSRTYDPATGFTDLVTDFNGTATDYDYNARGLETQRIEAKSVIGGGTPTEKRTIQNDWHATYHVPTERRTYNVNSVMEAKTDWIYNTRGQVTARCEIDPADATNYTCSPTNAPSALAKVRRWTYTYCEAADVTNGACPTIGLLTAVNGPRLVGDMGMGGADDITTYTYFQLDDPSCGLQGGTCSHRHGDLWKVTNALGQVTEYVSYDKNGRVTLVKDSNITSTNLIYNVRGWLTDRIVQANSNPGSGDSPTHFDYDAVGNVVQVTQPDGDYLVYTYDTAHRLIKITDRLNNSVDYCPGGVGSPNCLDSAGARKVEQTKDQSNTLKRSLSRVYNQLGELTRVLNATSLPTERSDGINTSLNGVTIVDGYDPNGRRVLVDDGLGTRTNQNFDALSRLKSLIQNYGGLDASHDATTQYFYDTRDNLRQVTDPETFNTVYTYDGLNNLTGLSSPDTGNTTYSSDKAGNRISQTDSRNILTTYSYDRLNRLRTAAYPTSSLNFTYTYDQSNVTTGCAVSYPVGRLTTMTDGSGKTTYCYDRRGNVLVKKQVSNGITLTTSYAYTLGDRLASVTYPSGMLVTYARDAMDRVTFVSYKIGTVTTTLVNAATYYPFGPLNVVTFGSGRTLTKTYDTNYAIDRITSSVSGGLTLDLGVDVMGDITSASGTIAPPTPDRMYTYDPLYRLTNVQTGALPPAPLEQYTYNKTGDRLSAALNGGAASAYTYTAGMHRLASVGGTARSYDANGNTKTGVVAGSTFNFDDKNRFASVTAGLNTYGYQTNGRGERVVKTHTGVGAATTEYVYDESGNLLGEYGSTGAAQNEHIFLDGTPIGAVVGGNVYYIEADYLGTPRQLVNPTTNAVTWSWSLLGNAFGASAPISSGATLNLRFPGQYYDTETGLNYNLYRDYEIATGRYVESDPIGLRGGLSTYAYVRSNPTTYFDLNGLFTIDDNCKPCKFGIEGIHKQVKQWCETLATVITNPKLRSCIDKRCKNAKVKCRDCDDDSLGYERSFLGLRTGTAVLCIENFPIDTQAIGPVAIHEWAHSCRWEHGDGGGVPGDGGTLDPKSGM